MRRVSIGMIEAVLFIKYRNTQPDSTAVLLKEYRSTLRTVLQYFLRSTGRCLSHLSKSLLPRPGRVPWRLLASLLGIGVTAWCILYGIVPRQLFPAPCSTLLYSAEGELLGARIAPDGQWRFPAADSLPDKFVDCLLTYEDKRFFYHPGIDPAAIFRAIRLNGKAGRVVSGGSTLTMQLARIARGNQNRTFYEKTIEMCWALFLETTYSKQDHLDMESITALNNGMKKFPGVLLFSSRDHQIVETTANRIMEILPGGKMIDKITTYDEYLASEATIEMRRRALDLPEDSLDKS